MATVNLDREHVDRNLFMNVCVTKTTPIAERALFHLFQADF